MSQDETNLITQIEGASERLKLSTATICERAVGNSRLYLRLKAGGGCTLKTAKRLAAYIEANRTAGADQ